MITFAPHRDTLESFIDCIHGGVDGNTLTLRINLPERSLEAPILPRNPS